MIDTTSENGLTTVTLDRPARRNALTTDGLTGLERAIAEAADPVVYLTGAGTAFCAGADFDTIASLDGKDEARTFAALGQSVAETIERSDTIVVAGIDGPARGGGVELALAADLRIATPEASFAATGIDIGLFGAWGGTVRLPEVVGVSHGLDIALSGRTVSATEAADIGLVSRIVEKPRAVAKTISQKPARSLRVIKQRVRDRGATSDRLEREQDAFASLIEAGPELPS